MLNFRPKIWHILSFLVPAILMLGVYAIMDMAPFGDRTILAMDMADQYVEFFCALKHGDIYFSWSKALGSSYIGVFSYYVSSPLSLLTLLVPNEYMPVGLMFLTVLKVGLAGLTYSLFVRRFFGKINLTTLLGAMAYCLCSYTAAYSMCIMWLDGLIWLPVILLTLERLMDGKSAIPFAAALTVCFISGWYISYMVGGFCLLWFIFRCICRRLAWSDLLRRFGKFLLAALWALFASAWLWLPSFLSMFSGKLSDAVMDYSSLTNFGWEFFLQFLPGQYNSLTGSALPFVFCGTLTPILFIGWIFCRKFPLRQRLAGLGLVCVLLLSLWLAPLDKVWHLFKFPNWFPYRYTFLLSFVLVLFAQQMLDHITSHPIRFAQPLAKGLYILLCFELVANTLIIWKGVDKQFGYESYSEYLSYYSANEELLSRTDEDGFYRVGATADRGFNSPLSFGYAGITHYSSVYNGDVNTALKSLGFAQSWMWSAYYGSTPLTDAVFGVKYVLNPYEMPGYASVCSVGELTLWENPTTLPLLFAADRSAADISTNGATPITLQNILFSALAKNQSQLFTPIVPTIDNRGNTVVLTFVGIGKPIYADLSSGGLNQLKINGNHRCWLSVSEEQRIHYLGTPAAGESLVVEISYQSPLNWENRFYTCEQSLLSPLSGIDTDVSVNGSRVSATVTVAEDQILLTTVPAEPGWSVWVDGESTETGIFLNAFLSISCPAGEHTVEMRYTPPGLYPALALGGIALLWAAAVLLHHKKKSATT